MAPTFAEATAVTPSGTHTYTANFHSEWCIGSVPHGGVVAATFLNVAAAHFGTTLAAQNQPHTISLHTEFVRRTSAGIAHFAVHDVKLGRGTSTIHVVLTQDGRDEVVAYMTNANMTIENGLTLLTGWSTEPLPPPRPVDFARLARDGVDEHWKLLTELPHPDKRKAVNKVRMYAPRDGHVLPNIVDEWICFASGERFRDSAVAFVSDMWPQLLEGLVKRQTEIMDPKASAAEKSEKQNMDLSWYWYPTLTLSLDVKKPLPAEGVQWLHVRALSKQVRNGRFDYEIVIYDENEEIVALSHHIAMVLDGARNLAAKRKGKKAASKI
ncbi:thioesterase-like superfamily-domain-containing protein [Xylariaceae sp. FL0255]|nr:thioesterase-like superfamily-domain-containing protein [Xylariaceae sp. FL0255]